MSTEKGLKRPGDYSSRDTLKLMNQTGAALVAGSLVALNFDFAAATYNVIDYSVNDIRANAVAVTTENATRVVAVALAPIASGAKGEFGFNGYFPVACSGAVNRGSFFSATNAATTLTAYANQAALDALALPTGIAGIILETTAGAGTPMCLFNGDVWRNLIGGGA